MVDDMANDQLIKNAQAGNRSAFEALINAHYLTIYKFAYKFIGNRPDAEDIAQDACMKLAANIDSFRFDSAFTTWLYRLVINTAKDFIKKKSRHQSRESALFEDAIYVAAPDNQEKQFSQREVLKQVDDLPEKLRDVVILVCWEGLSHAEAAAILDIKENTVSWRLHEVRKIMNDTFNKEAHHG